MSSPAAFAVDVAPWKDAAKRLLIALQPECSLCHSRCGCIQCSMMLPCTCTKICGKCLTYPCACNTGFTPKWMDNAFKSLSGIITNNVQAMNLIGQSIIQYMKISATANTGSNTVTINAGGSTGLVTGAGFFNPSMLADGTADQQLARKRAIFFRDLMLGPLVKDLYSPQGLIIESKIWPGVRAYVFYTHHVSCQVYDHGKNIGRLDVNASGQNVPMGDVHLAAILKVMYDEEDMIKSSRFSRVRDI